MRVPISLSLAFVGLLLAATVCTAPSARAQDATPAALPPLLQQMVDAINARDSAALAALYTEDGVHEDVPAGVTARGQEEIAAFVDMALGQFSEVLFVPLSAGQAGEIAVLEYDFAVTDQASGQPVNYRGVLVFELDGDLIRRSADYYDAASILGQLGLLPPAVGEGTPGP